MIGGQKKGDPRVRKALDQLDCNYDVDDGGDFSVTYGVGDGRSQTATINSNTESYGTIEIREVWSIAQISSDWPSEKLANYLLRDNAQIKFGAWQLHLAGDGDVAIVFAAQIAAEVDSDTLLTVLKLVLLKADGLEEKLGGDDDF